MSGDLLAISGNGASVASPDPPGEAVTAASYGLAMTEPAYPLTEAANHMLSGDRASTGLGIEVVEAQPGRAVATLQIAEHHCNGLGVCHGGFIFTLADTAMAFATNAGGGRAFATNAEIDFVEAARPGDVITATCRTIIRRGRAGVSDTEVTNQRGETIAVFRGRTLATRDES